MGGYSENTSEDNPSHHHSISPFPDIYYNTANGGGINMNMPATFTGGHMDREAGENMQGHFSLYQSFHQPSHTFDETHGFRPQFFVPAVHVQGGGAHPVPIPETLYGPGFDGASSIAGFKSWLRQSNQYLPEKMMPDSDKCNYQSLSLTMSNSIQMDCAGTAPTSASSHQPITDDRKRQIGKSGSREALPRKSIETFGQRTSQYRGVTR